MRGMEAKIHLKEEAKPKFCKARPLPYALRERVETEITRLVELGIFEPVEVSNWAAPIVPIVKSDQSIRLCGDYKITVNQATLLDNYPIPKGDDLFTLMTGGERFSKLDLSEAYTQMVLSSDSRECLTINTHKGLFQPTRLPYGVNSAPGIFQREMEKRLNGIPYTVVRIDDILVSGRNDREHLANLERVLKTIQESGLRLKRGKCKFLSPEVVYNGMLVHTQGISPVEELVRAIKEAPQPTNISQLKSFLGMLNYYQRFIPDLSQVLEPLHRLLRKSQTWEWTG